MGFLDGRSDYYLSSTFISFLLVASFSLMQAGRYYTTFGISVYHYHVSGCVFNFILTYISWHNYEIEC